MENFKKVIKRRMHFAAGFNCLAVVFISFTGYRQDVLAIVSGNISDMIRGFQTGVFIGLQLFMVIFITKYKKAINSEDSLKKLYIEENDERKKLIRDKIGGTGLNFIIGSAAAAVVISGFFSETVFITLLAVLMFIAMVKGFLKLYYRNKF